MASNHHHSSVSNAQPQRRLELCLAALYVYVARTDKEFAQEEAEEMVQLFNHERSHSLSDTLELLLEADLWVNSPKFVLREAVDVVLRELRPEELKLLFSRLIDIAYADRHILRCELAALADLALELKVGVSEASRRVKANGGVSKVVRML